MNSLSRCFIIIFGFMGGLLLFCALIRLSNGLSPFISLSQLNDYFSQIDVYKPFKDFEESFNSIYNDFLEDAQNLQLWNYQINSISDFFLALVGFARWLGTIIYDLFKILGLPFYALFYFIEFLVNLFTIFFGFTTNLLV